MDAPLKSTRPTPGQLALAELLASGGEMLGEGIARLPASPYIDEDRFVTEQDRLLARVPLVLGPSAMLPSPRTAVAHDGYGVPLIVSRDGSGQVHVHANACRHRGTRLVEGTEVVPAARIVCPYHAWAYKPDGALAGLPRADCFPGLDKSAMSLLAFPAVESGGLIWFSRDPQVDFALAQALAEQQPVS